MRFTQTVAGPLLAALCLTIPVAPAHAATVVAHGALCSLDTGQENGTQSGLVSGGPVAAYDAENPAYRPDPYVVCSIQVGGNGTFADVDAAQVLFWEVGYVGYLPPMAVAYAAPAGLPVFLCSEIWVATSDGHFSIYYDDVERRFELNPATANCQLAAKVTTGGLTSVHAPQRIVAFKAVQT